ncbi:MAG: amino acid adenylation domain-containing protein [Halanaerobiales bacterium]|nr:amino acid adenylation domain-containing protein [Halanaerobiales bacterium]
MKDINELGKLSDLQKQDEQFWLNKFSGELTETTLPFDYKRNQREFSYQKEIYYFSIKAELSTKLSKISKNIDTLLFTILMAGLKICISKYTKNNDITIGTTIHKKNEKIKYINTILPIRDFVDSNISVKEFIVLVKTSIAEAYQHQKYSFSKLLSKLSFTNNALFNITLLLENINDIDHIDGLDNGLLIIFQKEGTEITGRIEYNAYHYKQTTIRRFSEHLITTLSQMLDNSQQKISEISMLTTKERDMILYEFNDTKQAYPKHLTISEIFEEQVEVTPDKIAIIFGGKEMTYWELNNKSNQLARVLRNQGVGFENIVGMIVERSIEMIVGILGILKAGGAYLPIEPEYPENRIEFMLEDADVQLILGQKKFFDIISTYTGEWIDLFDEELYTEDVTNLPALSKADNLAYVIYTSGTTGKPKGNLTMHYNISRVVKNTNYIEIITTDRVLQLSNYAFDGSTFDIYAALLNGATLVLIRKEEIFDPKRLTEFIQNSGVTLFFITTALFHILVDNNLECFRSVRKVLVGGEVLSIQHAKKALEYLGKDKLINGYGPTESTVFATYYPINEISEEDDTVPIGKPLANTQVYIIDESNHLQPIGGVGELCISGDGLARGYLNQSDLTKNKFVDNPFVPGSKMYRSGDLARWNADGQIEFVGRVDHQVKIRGYRIELSAIEAKLKKHHSINDALVIAREDQLGISRYLCAYIVTNNKVSVSEIKKYLLRDLPNYMLPAHFVVLERMPLNLNGKIDHRALPEPKEKINEEHNYVAPTNDLEKRMTEIWSTLLENSKIGIYDDFFELGGHSLTAVTLAYQIHKEFNVEVNLDDIFRAPTVKELSELITNAEKAQFKNIEPIEERDYYKVSSAQKRLLLINHLSLESISYNMPLAISLEGKLDKEKFIETFYQLIKRHESLRTSFDFVEGEPVQLIHKDVDFNIPIRKAEREELQEIIQEFIRPFDLRKAPLLRAEIIQYAENKYLLIVDMHHIISDGVSMGILFKELHALYMGEVLPELRIQYKDFAAWQNEYLQSEEITEQEEYWLNKLAGELPILELPTDYQRSSEINFEGDTVQFILDQELSEKVKNLATTKGTTLFMTLLAAFNLLMAKYTGQEDLIVGIPVAGRKHADLENIIGMFVNTLALRNQPVGDKTFVEFLEEIKKNALEAYANQDYQFEMLIGKLNIDRNTSRNPLFDVMFVLQNINELSVYENQFSSEDQLKTSMYDYEYKISKFDILLIGYEKEQRINFRLDYRTTLFKKDTIEKMARYFVNILQEIVQESEIRIEAIQMISLEERDRLIYEFNDTRVEYSNDKVIHQLFEEQVKKSPTEVVLTFGEEDLTYFELNEKANQLARFLRSKGVGSDTIIGVMVERSFEMIVGVLGILKAGGAYLPIDSKYPENRIKYMLNDCNVKLLLSCASAHHLLSQFSFFAEMIDINDRNLYTGDGSDLELINHVNDLAYIIYTSGSTGNPKGVMLEHRGVVNYITWAKKVYLKGERFKFPLYSSLSFDLTVTSIFVPLLSGSRIIVYGYDEKELLISKIIKENKVQIIKLTPAHLKVIRDLDLSNSKIKRLIVGGEQLTVKLAREIDEKFAGNIEIFNEYGPTETVVGCMIYKYDRERDQGISVPIGTPADNVQIYLLDERLKPVAEGITGQIYISGDGVARGYFNRTDLTKDRFVDNPFIAGKRMYKTGDLARKLPDGNIEFLSRIDKQVKIRGYRIELEEIEKQLQNYSEISTGIVVSKEDENGESYLCVFYVSDIEISISDLRKYLADRLPEYMVPTHFIQLDEIPLTINGKIDQKVLPEPGKKYITVEIEKPRDIVEEKLLKIWQDVLLVDKISIYDNFFELGGHSLKATQLLARIYKDLNVELSLMDVFEYTSIATLAEVIKDRDMSMFIEIDPVEEREYYPVSSAQKRLLIIDQLAVNSISYNMPLMIKIEGELNQDRFVNSINKLIDRHESLRTSFGFFEDKPIQKINQDVKFNVQYEEVVEVELQEVINRFVRPFNPDQAPLMRVGLIKYDFDKYLFMLDMHHIISDGVSMNIFFKELMAIYNDEELPELRIQYKDFAVWQNEFLQSEKLKEQEEYWLDQFAGELPVLNLPIDYKRPALMDFAGDFIEFAFNAEETEKLNDLVFDQDVTLFMILLAAYNVLLAKYSGQEDIIVGTPIAGRNYADLENIIGMFVNTLALRHQPEGGKSFNDFLAEVRNNTLKAFNNQNYQFEMLLDQLNLDRDTSRSPLFEVMFTLQNTNTISLNDFNISNDDFKISLYDYDFKIAKFSLLLNAFEVDEKIHFRLDYSTTLFKRETVESMVQYYINILREIIENSEKLIKEIQMISALEKEELIYGFNDTKAEYPKEKVIHQLFAEQVNQSPDEIAVSFGEEKLTYRELNQESNQLARFLKNIGVQRDQIVGIMVDRSLEMIIGILGILKAGGGYLPIDSEYPESRIEFMLNDSHAEIVLLQNHLLGKVNFKGEKINISDKELLRGDSSNLEVINQSRDLAYMIYTSGSTGNPKGVMIEHRGVVNYITWAKKVYLQGESLDFPLYSSLSFDLTVTSIYVPLLSGNKVIIYGEDDKELVITKIIKDNNIQIIKLTPAHLRVIRDLDLTNSKVKRMIVGGEELSVKLASEIYEKFAGNIEIYNEYGPTETVVGCMIYQYDHEKDQGISVPIGVPADNVQIYLVDDRLNPVAQGVIGEIAISGDGVARGYLNRPDLTAEKFVENPFIENQRMYKTGDLARKLSDGNIEFLGRKDNQVKIRGFRIEIGEIEKQLISHPSIIDAVVIDHEDKEGSKYLAVYLVSDNEDIVTEIRDYLLTKLPDYMIPNYFVRLDKLPLTSNGKIDRKALPEPEKSTEYVAPISEVQMIMAGVWEKILLAEKVGLTDNFFELGGDSIKALQIIAKLKQDGINISIKDIFTYRTIGDLLNNVDYSKQKIKISQDEVIGEIPLTPIQKWFFEQNFEHNHYWNQTFIFSLRSDADLNILESVFSKIITHHDALRMVYKFNGEQIVQYNRGIEEINFQLEVIDFSAHSFEIQSKKLRETSEEIQNSFDLEKDLLFKVIVFDLGENGKRLVIPVHHLIIDGVSWRIIFEEIQTLYSSNLKAELPLKTTSYKNWSEKLRDYAANTEIYLDYWKNITQTEIQSLSFEAADRNFSQKNLMTEITQEQTEELLKNVNWVYNTEINDLLLSALTIAITDTTGVKNILVNLEGHGREEIIEDVDISRTIGWFTSMYPVYFERQEGIEQTIKHVKESLRKIPNKGINFGIARYLETNTELEKLKPEISFNYLGQFAEVNSEDNLLSICKETSGRSIHLKNHFPYLIDIVGIVVNDRLQITFSYNPSNIEEKLIKLIQERYSVLLIEIIEHCLNKSTRTYTPSDFGDAVDEDEFGIIADLYNL